MPNLLRIGDFSQLAQVSVPALRHYDELGLLRPAEVDKFTDYRYYGLDQLPRLNRILALKELGLSLDQIKALLKDDLSPAMMRGMLAMKRADIETQIARERDRLARLEARMSQIEREDEAPRYEVVLKKVEPLWIFGARQIVKHVSLMGEARRPALEGLYAELRARGLRDIETESILYHNTEYFDDDIVMETAVILGKSAARAMQDANPEASNFSARLLPDVPAMATTIHHGTLYDIPLALVAIFEWIGRHGYHSVGPMRELHLFGSELALTEEGANGSHVVEIQVPVER